MREPSSNKSAASNKSQHKHVSKAKTGTQQDEHYVQLFGNVISKLLEDSENFPIEKATIQYRSVIFNGSRKDQTLHQRWKQANDKSLHHLDDKKYYQKIQSFSKTQWTGKDRFLEDLSKLAKKIENDNLQQAVSAAKEKLQPLQTDQQAGLQRLLKKTTAIQEYLQQHSKEIDEHFQKNSEETQQRFQQLLEQTKKIQHNLQQRLKQKKSIQQRLQKQSKERDKSFQENLKKTQQFLQQLLQQREEKQQRSRQLLKKTKEKRQLFEELLKSKQPEDLRESHKQQLNRSEMWRSLKESEGLEKNQPERSQTGQEVGLQKQSKERNGCLQQPLQRIEEAQKRFQQLLQQREETQQCFQELLQEIKEKRQHLELLKSKQPEDLQESHEQQLNRSEMWSSLKENEGLEKNQPEERSRAGQEAGLQKQSKERNGCLQQPLQRIEEAQKRFEQLSKQVKEKQQYFQKNLEGFQEFENKCDPDCRIMQSRFQKIKSLEKDYSHLTKAKSRHLEVHDKQQRAEFKEYIDSLREKIQQRQSRYNQSPSTGGLFKLVTDEKVLLVLKLLEISKDPLVGDLFTTNDSKLLRDLMLEKIDFKIGENEACYEKFLRKHVTRKSRCTTPC